jgi:putative tributyrin esterase
MTLDTAKLKEELDGDHFRNHFFLFNSSFGESGSIDGSKHDIYAAAKKHKENGDALCKFYLCCGSEEFIRWRVEADVRLLRDLGYRLNTFVPRGITMISGCGMTILRSLLTGCYP